MSFSLSAELFIFHSEKYFGQYYLLCSYLYLYHRFFFPTSFFLNEKEVKIKRVFTTIVRPWVVFRGFYYDKNGVQLTPFSYPSRLDTYRGLFLKFKDNKDEVVEFIKKHLSPITTEKLQNIS